MRPRPILAVLGIFFIQLFPNWTACSPITYTNTSDIQFIEEVEAFASSTADQLPATAQRLQQIIDEAQRNDVVCVQVRG